ncbi:MAG TPA: alpha-amylase/4-alpha-glucanotransferase domain-containing protein [Candidatus Kapabacteria bacterium]|nr:alpha-amylase/4-alpha-glucanotransferase domain-containing protein [Candidatus Kapabacteria bacterium]
MITLALAFHNHQPVGNFGWVIEDAYQRAYLPLMRVLSSYPSIRFAQHYTGILLDWFAEHHPDLIQGIVPDVTSGRIELLGGGYYEPILSMLPERDRIAQITRLSHRIEQRFGVAPSGMWLAERVWEPSLPSTLHGAGMRYTILDDTHFKLAGLRESDLTGYFLTEDQGRPLAVLPIDKRLRYTMPFEAPEATLEYLQSLDRPGEDRLVVFADDGEKFGVWPDTYRTVYEHGWLEHFCELLVENASWVRTVPPGEVVATTRPAGRIYLPTASYAEMLHWALPTAEGFLEYEAFEQMLEKQHLQERYGRFAGGGFWRNFQVKYPEINTMQKKMLRVSDRLARLREEHPERETEIERAYTDLLASQCNCPYWHGVFGGIYLANIRMAMYRSMIAAERALDAVEEREEATVAVEDYNLDGNEEIIYENRQVSVYLAPALGGSIFEFDYKPLCHNFIDLLNRRREGYHVRLSRGAAATAAATAGQEEARSIHDIVRVKESGLERALRYDRYQHALLLDHFLANEPVSKDLRNGTLAEIGDFFNSEYAATVHREGTRTHITLRREGTVRNRPMAVQKRIVLDDGSADMEVEYNVEALDGRPIGARFGIEMAYAMSAGTEPDRYYEFSGERPEGAAALLNSSGIVEGDAFALVDEWLEAKISVELGSSATIVRAPIETVSLSEEGFERNYQGSVLLAVWDLGEASAWRMAMNQRVMST